MKKQYTFLFLFVFLFGVQCTAIAQKGINRWQVRKVVKNLSDDDMKGREAGTPNARKAAEYISDYFEKYDLQPLKGENGFLQEFTLHEMAPSQRQLQVNGYDIPAEDFFMISQHEQVNWEDTAALEHVHISKEEDFRSAFQQAYKKDTNVLVTVDGSHVEMFNQYGKYFSQNTKTMQMNQGHTKLFVLSNEIALNTVKFEAKQKIKEIKMANVAGMIPGKSRPDEYVIFSAHYDHIGILDPVEGDSIANGADDDASGTTAVMLLARHYSKIGGGERSIIFVAFTAEEIGGYGSKYFSKQMEPEKIAAMFNIEMIGKEAMFGPETAYITGFDKSNFGELLQKNLAGTSFHFYGDPYPAQNLFYRSDNATLARLGVPAHTISTVQIDKDDLYHTVGDEYKSLDIRNMTGIIDAIAISSKGIVNGENTPTRVDQSTVH